MKRILLIEDSVELGIEAWAALRNAGLEDIEVEFWCISSPGDWEKEDQFDLDGEDVPYLKIGLHRALSKLTEKDFLVGIFDLVLQPGDSPNITSVNRDALDLIDQECPRLKKYVPEGTSRQGMAAALLLMHRFAESSRGTPGIVVTSVMAILADSFLEELGLPAGSHTAINQTTHEEYVSEVTRVLEQVERQSGGWTNRFAELKKKVRLPRLEEQMESGSGSALHGWVPERAEEICWWAEDRAAAQFRKTARRHGFSFGINELSHYRLKGIYQGHATTGGVLAGLLEISAREGPGEEFRQELECSGDLCVNLTVNGKSVTSTEELSHGLGVRGKDRIGAATQFSIEDEARLVHVCLALGGGEEMKIEARVEKTSGRLILKGRGKLKRDPIPIFAGRNLSKCQCPDWVEDPDKIPSFSPFEAGDLLASFRDLAKKGLKVYQLVSLPVVGEIGEGVCRHCDVGEEDELYPDPTARIGGYYAPDPENERVFFGLTLRAAEKWRA